ncbi:YkoP family protein [Cytobacillus kochii]
MTLSYGTVINKNDVLLKIHLHNVELLRQKQDI